ncbi:serine-rich adhesin for platelets-like [Montipora foliosa]|uniref:serine-rich adhesin for platelets-like n=1 Tax=Montipora foliosa TaxID=591990 RepID=UPI0035F201B0
MEFILCFLLSLFVKLSFVSGSDIYPSIHWVPQNPILQADGDTCGEGPRYLKVQLNSKVSFICPNLATVLQKGSTAIQTSAMYENLWLLQNETAFEKCDITLDPNARRLLTCNSPSALLFTSVIFAQFTAEDDGLTFEGGKTYYFIATSDGTESHLNDTSGGHCMDVSNNIYMKIEVYVCEKGSSSWQDPSCQSDVGYLRCPSVTNVIPLSSRANPSISSPATTPITEEVSTTASFQSSMSASTSLNVCDQSVITKTISSEVTKSAYCPWPNVGDTTISDEDLCKRCIAPSSSRTTSASRVKPTELNRETAKQEQLSENKDSSSNGAWKTTAVVVTTLLGLTILVGAIIYVKYRTSFRFGSCPGSTLHEVEYNETEMESPH